ncbi:MAG TPA: nuclear transport factor 2 family protein [Candidatus Binatia bacterium]|nr:nuclear transport factor 2 family protein [Candidatus Binatia bacterium]
MSDGAQDAGSDSIDAAALDRQEALFARAFAERDLALVRPLYDPDVVYVSPTVRLFDWPDRIVGVDGALEFIALTIRKAESIGYDAVERALLDGGRSAFVRIHFDWTRGERRLRSNYVVLYRYRARLIAQQELYYDPSGKLEELQGR